MTKYVCQRGHIFSTKPFSGRCPYDNTELQPLDGMVRTMAASRSGAEHEPTALLIRNPSKGPTAC